MIFREENHKSFLKKHFPGD